MALTTGINIVYSSAFRNLPQKALIGSPSTVYEPIQESLESAGHVFRTYFQYTIPVGFGWASTTNYDVLYLSAVGGNYPNPVPNTVNPGYRISRVAIRSSANAGGAVPIFIGFATANNIFNANANTSGYLGGGTLTAGSIAVAGTISGPTGSTFIQSANQALADVVPTGNLFNNTDTIPVLNAADYLVLSATTAGAVQTTTLCTLSGYVEFFLTGPTGF